MYYHCYIMTEKQWQAFVNQHKPKLVEWWTRLTIRPRYFLSLDICNAITDDGKEFTVYTNLEA